MSIAHYLIILIISPICFGQINIINFGTLDYEDGDMALILFITLENLFNDNLDLSVRMVERDTAENGTRPLYLIGENIYSLKKKRVINATLIYPNMYLSGIYGTCTIAIKYQGADKTNEIKTDIQYRSKMNKVPSSEDSCDGSSIGPQKCKTEDLDPDQDCSPVDCMMKYSGERSYFNKAQNLCQSMPFCLSAPNNPEVIYQIDSNTCRPFATYITTTDLQELERNQVVDCNCQFMINSICHHGTINKETGMCECLPNWTTSPDPDEMYQPTLQQYHVCNVEINSWNSVNKNKIKTTILLICIFALTIASKVIIFMCLLTWCIKWIRKPFSKNKGKKTDVESGFRSCLCRLTGKEGPKDTASKQVDTGVSPDGVCMPCKESECECELCTKIGNLIDNIIETTPSQKSEKSPPKENQQVVQYALCQSCKEPACVCDTFSNTINQALSNLDSKSSRSSKSTLTRTSTSKSKIYYQSNPNSDAGEAPLEKSTSEGISEEDSDDDEDYEIEFSGEVSEEDEEDDGDNRLAQIKEEDEDDNVSR